MAYFKIVYLGQFSTNRMFSFGKKNPAFPFHFFVYEVYGSEFCMSVYHHIRQLVVQEFFPTRSAFPGKRQKLVFFCFHRVTKLIKIKSPLKYKSVCGRVVKPSGFSTALSSCNRFITGSCLDGAPFTHHFFYNFELEYCLPAFHC